jgi:hypothetical protein
VISDAAGEAQVVPSQVATPFAGVEHGVHDVVPQLLGLMLD